MSRPPNPYRDDHLRLESLAGQASNKGELGKANRLWREAAALKRKGQEEVDQIMRDRAKETND